MGYHHPAFFMMLGHFPAYFAQCFIIFYWDFTSIYKTLPCSKSVYTLTLQYVLYCFYVYLLLWMIQYQFIVLTTRDHEITLKISEFVLNSIEKVKPGFLLSSMCIFSELNKTKSSSHSFHLENSGILQIRMGKRRHPMKINFDNFQMEKWVS